MTEAIIRDLKYRDLPACAMLVEKEWGCEAAERAHLQMIEAFRMTETQLPPHFYVVESEGEVIGFAGFKATMLMKNAYDLIWIALAPKAQGLGFGTKLTNLRLDEIARRGGTLVSLMTEKPNYFRQFGFEVARVFDGWHLMTKQLGKVGI